MAGSRSPMSNGPDRGAAVIVPWTIVAKREDASASSGSFRQAAEQRTQNVDLRRAKFAGDLFADSGFRGMKRDRYLRRWRQ